MEPIPLPEPSSPIESRTLQPAGWPRPKGYANGMMGEGRFVFTAGVVGWLPDGRFVARTLAGQVRQALENILAILAEGEAGPEHVVRLTWYVTSRKAYHDEIEAIGAHYRDVMGRNYPAMAVVEVSALMEEAALVEIEATAIVPFA